MCGEHRTRKRPHHRKPCVRDLGAPQIRVPDQPAHEDRSDRHMLNIAAHHPNVLPNRRRDSSPTSNLGRYGSWTTLADTSIDPQEEPPIALARWLEQEDRKSTRLNSSH